MPIPFHDLGSDEPSGVAGYLRFIDEPEGPGIRGALFTMSTRGEPLEFTFTRISFPSGVLWRPGQARTRAVAALVRVLFESAQRRPDVALALATETPATVFAEEIRPEIPLCRVATEESAPDALVEEVQQLSEGLNLHWTNGLPPPESTATKTVELLVSNRLLLEPFDRAALGIREAFES